MRDDMSDQKVGREKERGRREERRKTREKGNGGMGKGRAARNYYWAGGVCKVSACMDES